MPEKQMLNVMRFAMIVFCLLSLGGCGTEPVTVDDAPFRDAIGQYLEANNMAMKVKEIKETPVIEGDKAHVQASLVHEQLAGPSVTWNFEFAKQTDGTWRAVKHED
jgi:hypothetical protein